MLVRDSKKHQPEFDMAEAQRFYTESGWGDEPDPGEITSPYDLFAVELLRDRWNSHVGQSVPTDVFVFGKGQPPRPECTHIGGDPFWPLGREWPTDASGKPYLFFGQINFADSKDLVGELPGDLLLNVPYPWLNVTEPLGLWNDEKGDGYSGCIHDKDNEVMFGDLGSIYFYRDDDGEVKSSFECSWRI